MLSSEVKGEVLLCKLSCFLYLLAQEQELLHLCLSKTVIMVLPQSQSLPPEPWDGACFSLLLQTPLHTHELLSEDCWSNSPSVLVVGWSLLPLKKDTVT